VRSARAAARWIARRLVGEAPPPKRAGELEFWRREIEVYVRWLRGELPTLYGIPAPAPHEVVVAETEVRSAILTWTRKDAGKYLTHLGAPAGIFRGMRVLELGCGPIPYALAFTDCTIIGLDPLVPLYRDAGYPLGAYSERLHYVCAAGEQIPLATGSVDAVVSVNAIDHVDDLSRVAREIDRVVAADGVILIEAHYHMPQPLEPWAIDDRMMADLFGGRGLRKVAERPFTDVYPMEPAHDGERLTVWSNRSERGGS
jgi:SAM-dependent methyltransferase